jgi:hypothetical protein
VGKDINSESVYDFRGKDELPLVRKHMPSLFVYDGFTMKVVHHLFKHLGVPPALSIT